jgi:hypothetical protein
MRGLFRWALKAQLRNTDPTAGVDNPVRKGGEGFTPWTEEQVAAYEARWPIGKRQLPSSLVRTADRSLRNHSATSSGMLASLQVFRALLMVSGRSRQPVPPIRAQRKRS